MAGNLKYQSHWLIDLVDPDANHDKYYEVYIVPPQNGLTEWLAVRHWGRRGTKGGMKVERGDSAFVMSVSAKIKREKLDEGYASVSTASAGGVLPDQTMEMVAQQLENPTNWKRNGWAEAVTTTDVLVPDKVQVDISGFIQELLACQNVTAEQASKRSTFRDQIETLRAKVAEAEAAAELMDTVYSRRLA